MMWREEERRGNMARVSLLHARRRPSEKEKEKGKGLEEGMNEKWRSERESEVCSMSIMLTILIGNSSSSGAVVTLQQDLKGALILCTTPHRYGFIYSVFYLCILSYSTA